MKIIKNILIVFAIIAVVSIAVTQILHRSFKNPEFCLKCHYMKPYYEQWQKSTHNKVGCIQCHDYKMGKITASALVYFMGYYNPRPIGDVKNESCLASGCHSDRMINSKEAFAMKIVFDHKLHMGTMLRGKMLRCTSCHSQIVQGSHVGVTEDVCFLCHFKGMQVNQAFTGCPSCHGVPEGMVNHGGYSVNLKEYIATGIECNRCHTSVVSGTGEVNHDKCYSCHPSRVEKYDDHKFIHDKHVSEKGIDCFYCHEKIKHGNIKMTNPLEVKCEGCHQNMHGYQKEMYMGVMGKGITDVPSRMFAAQVACDGCHTEVHVVGGKHVLGEAIAAANEKSCLACHEKGYDLMLRSWKSGVDSLAGYVDRRLKLVSTGKSSKEYNDAVFNLDFVRKSGGFHNIEYAVKLLGMADGVAENLIKDQGKDPDKDSILKMKGNYCATLCHNYIETDKVFPYRSIDFPHNMHISDFGIDCTECHSNTKHKSTTLTLKDCAACHHGGDDKTADCSRCHKQEYKLYYGKGKEYISDMSPDSMATAGVGCADCHLPSKGEPASSGLERCKGCHDDKYRTMPDEWKKVIEAKIKSIEEMKEKIEIAIEGAEREKKMDVTAFRKSFMNGVNVIEFIKRGQAVHNFEQAKASLNKVEGTFNALWDQLFTQQKKVSPTA
ncbi:MAG: NapC/NirT family cytochrome c [Candidatus Schekmanbacteria bacterium]|nr:NapC/NirT family cytochrome c [Candidatus Schekmanbacteria bacterium]